MKSSEYFSDEFLTKVWAYFANKYTKSSHSLDNVYSSLRRMCEYLQKEPLKVTSADAERYKAHLLSLADARKLKISYVMASFAQIKSFYSLITEHKFVLAEYVGISYTDPFQFVYISRQTENELTYQDLPSMEDVDKLLTYFKERNYMMYAAVILAYVMGLTVEELAKLKKNNIVRDQTNYYISFEKRAYADDNRYLLLKNDVADVLFSTISKSSPPFIYVLCNKDKQYSVRSLQRHLADGCKELEIPNITFSSLRNAALCMMLQGGCSVEEVARHAGLEGRWLCRFEKIDKKLVSDAATYLNFMIV